ncbi:MAG: amino acid racemase [Alphaproteobacteria bacterium]|nr:amino acid racemase [Alphaproteobacteria bacterium]
MRKLGLIGGMSWVSTAMYYEQINKGVARRIGGIGNAHLLIESFDFAPVARLQAEENWGVLADLLGASARRLQQAGAQAVVLCSNTMHKVYDEVAAAIEIPILHIGDVTAAKMVQDGVRRAGLIGTRFTMNESFYRDRIEQHGIAIATPDPAMMKEIDRIIYEELTRGTISRVSQRTLKTCLTIMGQARNQAVILGCTELVMLVDPVANVIPVYDTTALHCKAAVAWIMGDEAQAAPQVTLAAAGQR